MTTSSRKRVVVTGMGLVSPLGGSVETSWRRLIAGDSGARTISRFDAAPFPSRIACEITGEGEGAFDAADYLTPREQRRLDLFSIYMIAAADQAVADAGWRPESEAEKARAGVIAGSGIGGLSSIEESAADLAKKGRVTPFFLPKALINLGAGNLSIRYGLQGPNASPVTACATGTHAIGDAAAIIARDDADVILAGGAEAPITPLGIAGFCACKALSTSYNDRPQEASRPWDEARDGFVIGEGAAILVLESLEHARARGAKIYAEITGYGMSGDAWHVTAPSEDGGGAQRAMRSALRHAGITSADIDYINAHGTSTPLGDEVEIRAIENLCAEDSNSDNGHISVSSTKSSIGHLLGAAGAAEAVFAIMAMKDNVIPPTLNLENPIVQTKMDLTPKKARQKSVRCALSNSFGFGGTNASLVFREWSE